MKSQIELLQKFCKNHTAVYAANSYLERNTYDKKLFKDRSLLSLWQRETIEDLEKYSLYLERSYGVDKEAFYLYASMDINYFPQFTQIQQDSVSKGFSFNDIEGKRYRYVKGYNIPDLYNEDEDLYLFFEGNIKLLLDSTREFILKKMDDRARANDFHPVVNDFQQRILFNKLSEDICVSELNKYYIFFNNLNNSGEALNSLYYLYSIILDKYSKNSDFKSLSSSINNIVSSFISKFNSLFTTKNPEDLIVIENITMLIENNEGFKVHFFNLLHKAYIYSDTLFFLSKYAVSLQQKDFIEKELHNYLDKTIKGPALDYSKFSNETKKAVLNDAVKQFFELNPHYIFKKA